MAIPGFLAERGLREQAPALVTRSGRVVVHGELRERALALGRRLGRARGLVAIEGGVGEHAVVGLVAAWTAGHAVALMPPDPDMRADFEARFAPDATWRPVDGRWRLRRSPGPARPLHPDLALLLPTSGSTDRARFVRLSAGAVDANARSIGRYLGLGSRDRAALVLPLHYSYGLSVLTSHLAAGASVWLHGGSVLDDDFLAGLAAQRCSNLSGVPYSFELLERVGFREAALPDLRFMTVAGGRLAPERVRLYDAHLRARGGRFFVMYGQTEATARIAYLPPERAADRADRIGVAIPDGALSLVAADGRPIEAAGETGELVYRGPNVMMGYAEARPDLGRGSQVEALATGDLAERDADGLYRIVGRLKRISKIGGVRIAHDALEAGLSDEGIEAAVVGDDERLLVVYEGAEPADAVRSRLAGLARVPASRVRAGAVDRLPRLASGKPDYGAVRALAAPVPAPVRRGVEADFREVFLPRAVAPEDSFASLGGDSLRHLELALALERRLGSLPPGWESMPVAALARLEALPSRGATPVGSDILIRALAILAVVVDHATGWPIPVGSAALVVLIGYGLARFQVRALTRDGVAGFLAPLPLVLLPYFAILAGYAVAWNQVPWASVFLVGNFGFGDPVERTMLPYLYWFVEVYVQILLGLALLFLWPAARRAALGRPFRFGLALLVAALVARAVGPALWPLGGRQIFTLPWVAPLAAFGWCAAVARGRQRWLVLALAAAMMPVLAWDGGNWVGAWVRYGGVAVVIGVLAFLPTLRVPGFVVPGLLVVAAASYPIYLVHRFAPTLLLAPVEPVAHPAAFAAASIVAGMLLGVLLWHGQRLLVRRWPARPRPARSGAGAWSELS
jgi:acyl-CoA synthetase (AMP-forming)/AMP-acid ligase II